MLQRRNRIIATRQPTNPDGAGLAADGRYSIGAAATLISSAGQQASVGRKRSRKDRARVSRKPTNLG